MAETDDPTDAMARLEAALERIAALAQPAAAAPATAEAPVGFDSAAMASRLDGLILRLRGALEGPEA